MSGIWSLCRCYHPPGAHTNSGQIHIFPILVDFALCLSFYCIAKAEKASLFILVLKNLSCNLLFWNWECFKIMCTLSGINVCTAVFQCHLTVLLRLMTAKYISVDFRPDFCNAISLVLLVAIWKLQ